MASAMTPRGDASLSLMHIRDRMHKMMDKDNTQSNELRNDWGIVPGFSGHVVGLRCRCRCILWHGQSLAVDMPVAVVD